MHRFSAIAVPIFSSMAFTTSHENFRKDRRRRLSITKYVTHTADMLGTSRQEGRKLLMVYLAAD
jgi:hypothetical protein